LATRVKNFRKKKEVTLAGRDGNKTVGKLKNQFTGDSSGHREQGHDESVKNVVYEKERGEQGKTARPPRALDSVRTFSKWLTWGTLCGRRPTKRKFCRIRENAPSRRKKPGGEGKDLPNKGQKRTQLPVVKGDRQWGGGRKRGD